MRFFVVLVSVAGIVRHFRLIWVCRKSAHYFCIETPPNRVWHMDESSSCLSVIYGSDIVKDQPMCCFSTFVSTVFMCLGIISSNMSHK